MEHTTGPSARFRSLTRIRRGGEHEHTATSGFLDEREAFVWTSPGPFPEGTVERG
jgi:hypothetical protein